MAALATPLARHVLSPTGGGQPATPATPATTQLESLNRANVSAAPHTKTPRRDPERFSLLSQGFFSFSSVADPDSNLLSIWKGSKAGRSEPNRARPGRSRQTLQDTKRTLRGDRGRPIKKPAFAREKKSFCRDLRRALSVPREMFLLGAVRVSPPMGRRGKGPPSFEAAPR